MCGTDWSIESFDAPEFPELFKTVQQLKKNRICWQECGIVQVEVTLVKVITKGDF